MKSFYEAEIFFFVKIFSVNPTHLINRHNIDIEPFSIESVYSDWKDAKKKWRGLKREAILEKGEILMNHKINSLKNHVVTRETAQS